MLGAEDRGAHVRVATVDDVEHGARGPLMGRLLAQLVDYEQVALEEGAHGQFLRLVGVEGCLHLAERCPGLSHRHVVARERERPCDGGRRQGLS